MEWSVRLSDESARERLDKALASLLPELSRTELKRWLEEGRVLVDGKPASARRRYPAGTVVVVHPAPEPVTTALPEPIPLTILYRDDDLLVVDKQAGLVVHPAAGHPTGTLVNAVLHHAPVTVDDDPLRPGIVHRLDKDTSGVMVIARSKRAKDRLVEAFQAHDIERRYLAITVGIIGETRRIDRPIGRHPKDRKRFSSRTGSGKPAVTHVTPREPLRGATLVECRLETGRTHQIRVHLSDDHRPLVGDAVYGGVSGERRTRDAAKRLGRQALHATVLAFAHPADGRPLRFETTPPDDFQAALAALRD